MRYVIRDVWTPGSGELRYTVRGSLNGLADIFNGYTYVVQVRARNHLSRLIGEEDEWSDTAETIPVPVPRVQGDAAGQFDRY